jgi:hypothetical protein
MAERSKPMRKAHQDDVRKKISASHIIIRMDKAFRGELVLTDQQVTIAKILLAKVLPDLKAIEHSGDVDLSLKVEKITREIVRPK